MSKPSISAILICLALGLTAIFIQAKRNARRAEAIRAAESVRIQAHEAEMSALALQRIRQRWQRTPEQRDASWFETCMVAADARRPNASRASKEKRCRDWVSEVDEYRAKWQSAHR